MYFYTSSLALLILLRIMTTSDPEKWFPFPLAEFKHYNSLSVITHGHKQSSCARFLPLGMAKDHLI